VAFRSQATEDGLARIKVNYWKISKLLWRPFQEH